jgi:hypothetical protein
MITPRKPNLPVYLEVIILGKVGFNLSILLVSKQWHCTFVRHQHIAQQRSPINANVTLI